MHAGRSLIVLVLGGVYLAMSGSSGHAQSLCFDAAVNYAAGSYPASIRATDLDGDSDLDLVVVNNCTDPDSGGVTILMNIGDGSFAAPVHYASAGVPLCVIAADLDGDGHPDLAVTNAHSRDLSVMKNKGDGTFAAPVNYSVGMSLSVCAADLDGDGDLDLAVANMGKFLADSDSGGVSILMNSGDGSFAAPVRYGAGTNPSSVFAADLDRDGDLDLAVANFAADGDSCGVFILKNDGEGSFAAPECYAAGQYPFSVIAADLDGDLDLDLAIANYGGPDVSVLKNNGYGSFAPAVNHAVGNHPASVFAADLDGDGDLDLAVGHYDSLAVPYSSTGNVSVLRNNGNGTFAAAVDYPAGTNPISVVAADLDGDSDLDLAIANVRSGNVSILRNCSGVTAVGDADETARIKTFSLCQNYPNPFNAATQIRFVVPRYERVTLAVYDVLGRVVARLLDQEMDPGAKSIAWDGRDSRGKTVCSGVYFYRLTTSSFSETKKMMLLK